MARDTTDEISLTIFNNEAEKLLGIQATEVRRYHEEGNLHAYNKIFTDAIFKTYIIRVSLNNRNYTTIMFHLPNQFIYSSNIYTDTSENRRQYKASEMSCP